LTVQLSSPSTAYPGHTIWDSTDFPPILGAVRSIPILTGHRACDPKVLAYQSHLSIKQITICPYLFTGTPPPALDTKVFATRLNNVKAQQALLIPDGASLMDFADSMPANFIHELAHHLGDTPTGAHSKLSVLKLRNQADKDI
jgi:hypothetical protein